MAHQSGTRAAAGVGHEKRDGRMGTETGGLKKMAAPPQAHREALRPRAWAEASPVLAKPRLGA